MQLDIAKETVGFTTFMDSIIIIQLISGAIKLSAYLAVSSILYN